MLNGSLVTTAMVRPRTADGDVLQTWTVNANIFNAQS
jgi:hypothetical protein